MKNNFFLVRNNNRLTFSGKKNREKAMVSQK